jgi:hypothetical protein
MYGMLGTVFCTCCPISTKPGNIYEKLNTVATNDILWCDEAPLVGSRVPGMARRGLPMLTRMTNESLRETIAASLPLPPHEHWNVLKGAELPEMRGEKRRNLRTFPV